MAISNARTVQKLGREIHVLVGQHILGILMYTKVGT